MNDDAQDYLDLERIDPRVKVKLQPKDLGLYGNLRFLSKISSEPWTIFCALDDQLSAEILDALATTRLPSGANLIVFDQVLCEVCVEDDGTYSVVEVGTKIAEFAGKSSGQAIEWQCLEPPPAWIFGLWRTHYLRDIFPRLDFNWLDTMILSRAIAEQSVYHQSMPKPARIGFLRDRPPHPVGKNWRNPFGWVIHSLWSKSIRSTTGILGILRNWRVTLYFKHSFPALYFRSTQVSQMMARLRKFLRYGPFSPPN